MPAIASGCSRAIASANERPETVPDYDWPLDAHASEGAEQQARLRPRGPDPVVGSVAVALLLRPAAVPTASLFPVVHDAAPPGPSLAAALSVSGVWA
jgi:hypothetical protein